MGIRRAARRTVFQGWGVGCGVGVRGGLRTPKYGPNYVRLVVMATHIYFEPGVHVRF